MNSMPVRYLIGWLLISSLLWSACAPAPGGTGAPATGGAAAEAAAGPAAADATIEPHNAVVILVVDTFEPMSDCVLHNNAQDCAKAELISLATWLAEKEMAVEGCYEPQSSCVPDVGQLFENIKMIMQDQTCALTPEGQAHFMRLGASTWDLPGVSHGELVEETITQVAEAKPWGVFVDRGDTIVQRDKDEVRQEEYEGVFAVRVPTKGYTTESIASELSDRLMKLEERGFTKFVLNMSFVLLPCNSLLKENGYLDAYLQELNSDPTSERLRQIVADFAGWGRDISRQCYENGCSIESNEEDALYRLLYQYRTTTISVGAAGNMSATFPFAPALWSTVLSVSAEASQRSGSKADYSNSGEVMLPGAVKFGGKVIEGTSFAAPWMSYLMAQYLLNVSDVYCQGFIPPLKYAPTLINEQEPFRNLSVSMAASDFCTGFPVP